MSKVTFTLTGDDRMIKFLKEFPEEGVKKPVMAGFRKAAVPIRKAIVEAIPPRISAIKVAVKVKPARRALVMTVGIYAKAGVYQNKRGKKWDPYQLAYWFNYGTYANRSPHHKFVKPRRLRTADRRGGIMPDMFVDHAVERSKKLAAAELEKEWGKQMDKIRTKYGL